MIDAVNLIKLRYRKFKDTKYNSVDWKLIFE